MAKSAAVIGGGPSGLMAAEVLARAGMHVTVFEQMPSVGRKLLMAGRGGLNLTHAEPLPGLISRYGEARSWLDPAITAFPPSALVDWCHSLGQPTFTGSSSRIFPEAMKASPLLRAWLRRLRALGVEIRVRHRWAGWDINRGLVFDAPAAVQAIHPAVTILALGGASWPRLGSDGGWTRYLPGLSAPFRAANCGFIVDWSEHFRSRFAGRPLKRIAVQFGPHNIRGEAMITQSGLEGGAIYALSAQLRDAIENGGPATIKLDLRPDLTLSTLENRLGGPRRAQSLANTLRKQAGLTPEAIGLVQEALHAGANRDDLPSLIKALPIVLVAPTAIDRAISSAGGLRSSGLNQALMLLDYPGVFAAGEMLDWEAPTGGYLLQACFSTGVVAANGALAWLGRCG